MREVEIQPSSPVGPEAGEFGWALFVVGCKVISLSVEVWVGPWRLPLALLPAECSETCQQEPWACGAPLWLLSLSELVAP